MNNLAFENSIFKYKSFTEQSEGHIKQLLIDKLIYLPKPSELNDPFDCKADIYLGHSREKRIQLISNIFAQSDRLSEKSSKEQIEANLRKICWDSNEDIAQKICKIINEFVEKIGILCLTKKPDNLLMWSHYALNHTGICLQFDFSKGSILQTKCTRIHYSNKYPKIDLTTEPEKNWAKKVLLTKSCDWKYEKEWRFLDLEGAGEKNTPEYFVKGIIFGLRMSNDNIQKIISWYAIKKYIPKFYRTKMALKEYRIEIIPMSRNT